MELLEWTLLPEEIDFIRNNARGEESLVRYGLQICSLRLTSRFIAIYSKVSLKICNYLTKQLQIDLLHNPLKAACPNTEVKIKKQVSEFLKFKIFDESAHTIIEEWLNKNSKLVADKKELSVAIEVFLVKEKFILPTSSQLVRKIFALYNHKQLSVFKIIAANMTSSQKKFIDSLCDNEDNYKLLTNLKKSMGEANVKNIVLKVESLNKLKYLKFENLSLKLLDLGYIEKLNKLVEHYDKSAIRRIKPDTKRYTMVACHIHEVVKSAIDEIIKANDKLLGEIERRINRDFNNYYKKLKNKAKTSRILALQTLKDLLHHKRRDSITLTQFCNEIGDEKLKNIIIDCEELEEFDYSGKAKLAQHRYSYLHGYIEQFLGLDFCAGQGSQDLLKHIDILLKYRKLDSFPENLPSDFMETPWKQGLYDKSGKLNKKSWEIGLFFAVRKALNSGGLYIPQSKNHREFWAPLYNKSDWNVNKTQNYDELNLPKSPKIIINAIQSEFTEHFNKAASSLGSNSFAEFTNDKLKIHTDEPLPTPTSLLELQNLVDSHSEPIGIENLLTKLQRETNYLKAFQPIEGFAPQVPLQLPILNAAITAHATNLGLYGISKSTNGISIDKLKHASNWYITMDNLRIANELLINAQQKYWLTELFGKGERSDSDLQRFVINKKSLLGLFYPRDFGALTKSLGIYTHMSDQFTVFGTQVISCSVREALYVLEGFLDNQSIVQCSIHSTDTHGFTEILFALMYLLGISFQPHFKDLKDQQLYCFDRKNVPGKYAKMFSQEKISDALIGEQWDDMIRLVYSLKQRLIKPHVIMQKLNNQQSATKLAKALTHLGRIIKTIYILRDICMIKVCVVL